jgi:hypothetical protein
MRATVRYLRDGATAEAEFANVPGAHLFASALRVQGDVVYEVVLPDHPVTPSVRPGLMGAPRGESHDGLRPELAPG